MASYNDALPLAWEFSKGNPLAHRADRHMAGIYIAASPEAYSGVSKVVRIQRTHVEESADQFDPLTQLLGCGTGNSPNYQQVSARQLQGEVPSCLVRDSVPGFRQPGLVLARRSMRPASDAPSFRCARWRSYSHQRRWLTSPTTHGHDLSGPVKGGGGTS